MEDKNNEIEKILNEFPLEDLKQKQGVDLSKNKVTNTSKKKLKLPNKKILCIIGGIILVLIVGFIFIQSASTCEVPISAGLNDANIISLVKQQIIENGYVKIGEMTLAPSLN